MREVEPVGGDGLIDPELFLIRSVMTPAAAEREPLRDLSAQPPRLGSTDLDGGMTCGHATSVASRSPRPLRGPRHLWIAGNSGEPCGKRYRVGYSTNANRRPSLDQLGTLMVPCPPFISCRTSCRPSGRHNLSCTGLSTGWPSTPGS